MAFAQEFVKSLKGKIMGQMTAAASGENIQNKTPEFAGLFKMTGSSGEKIKSADSQSGKNEEDENNLVPFLQFLNQQMSQLNKYSDSIDSSKQNKNNLTLEQAASMLQDNVTLEELRQAIINMSASGETDGIDEQNSQTKISIDDLLNEVNLLKNIETPGNINTLLSSVIKQINNEGKAFDEHDVINVDKELKTGHNKNEAATISNQNITLNQSGQMILEAVGNDFLQGNECSEKTQISMKDIKFNNITGKKSDEVNINNANFQSELAKEAEGNENKFNIQDKGKDTALKSFENITQQQKINTSENSDKVAESISGTINIELAEGKEKSKTINNKTSMPVGSDSEIKESQTAKESMHSEKQQHLNIMNPDTGNKSVTEKASASAAELSGYIKTEQKGKNIPSEKGKEEITLAPINVTGSSSTGNEKINNVSSDRIIGQITQEIRDVAANDGGRVKIVLDPPSLGKLEMDVTVRNGKVEVVLVADNKDVQQTLNIHIDKLKGGLQNQGLTIDRCDVFMQENHDEYQQNFGRQAFYQDSGSQQNDNSRQGKSEEKVTADTIISTRSKTFSGISTDNISLFA